MYVLKNPLANEGLESPINRPAYYALDPELQTLYRQDNGVDEGDDEPTTLPFTEVREADEEDMYSSAAEAGQMDEPDIDNN